MDCRNVVEYREWVVEFMLKHGGYWLDPNTRTIIVLGQEHNGLFPIAATFTRFSAIDNGVEWFVFGKHIAGWLQRRDLEQILAHIEAIKANAATESAHHVR